MRETILSRPVGWRRAAALHPSAAGHRNHPNKASWGVSQATAAAAEAVRVLLSAGADPHARDTLGRTPLQCAAERGHVQAVRALLAAGALASAVDWRGTAAGVAGERETDREREGMVGL